jgi:hypothetical protein
MDSRYAGWIERRRRRKDQAYIGNVHALAWKSMDFHRDREGPNRLAHSHLDMESDTVSESSTSERSSVLDGWAGRMRLGISAVQSEYDPKAPVESQAWNDPSYGEQSPVRGAPVWTMSRRRPTPAAPGTLPSFPKCWPLCPTNSQCSYPCLADQQQHARQRRPPQCQRLPQLPRAKLYEMCLVVDGPVSRLARRSSPSEGASG